MRSLIHFAASAAAVLGLATAVSANDYWYTSAQREQIHQQYLSPMEHQALHQGLNNGYGSGLGGYQNSTPMNLPYGGGYGAGYGAARPTYSNGLGLQPFGLGRSRSRCGGAQYTQPYSAGYRGW